MKGLKRFFAEMQEAKILGKLTAEGHQFKGPCRICQEGFCLEFEKIKKKRKFEGR